MDESPSDIEYMDTYDSEESEATGKVKQSFFYVTELDVEVLLGCKATAEQISAFIVVAKSRQRNTHFLTAGSNAISKCLGVRPQKAKRIFSELSCLNHNGTNLVKVLHPVPIRRSAKLVDKGRSYGATLLQEHLVGHKTATKEFPISKLCKAGDISARLFLYLYTYGTQEVNGVIVSEVTVTNCLKVINNISIAYGKISEFTFPVELLRAVCSDEKQALGNDHMNREVSDALKKLISLMLVVPVVVVKVQEAFGMYYYDIHVKGEPLKGSLRERVIQIAQDNAVYQGRSDCRSHDGVYHFIAPQDCSVSLLQVLRPVYQYKPPSSSNDSFMGEFMLNGWIRSVQGTSCYPSGEANNLIGTAMSDSIDF